MIEDGIFDGDLVIIASRQKADNGQMVVANVAGEVTLKRIYQEGERVRLQPEPRGRRDRARGRGPDGAAMPP